MSLSHNQIDAYNRVGYISVEGFFSPDEVAAMRAELERFKRDGLIRNVSTEGDGRTTSTRAMNLQVLPLSDKSDLFRALPFHPKVVEAVTQLIGEPVLLELDQIFLKPGRHGAGTNWHQDNAYFKISDPTKGVGMWTALHDANFANGTMQVIPEVFREKFRHDRDPGSDHHVTMAAVADEDKAVVVELKAGGVLFFNYGVPHCTKGNNTDHERAGLALHFVREEFVNDEYMHPGQAGNPYINGPKASGGEKEYGRRLSGVWQEQVAKALATV
jgi:ectoine hydroxylase-related dioxygenase (phytanoyl-CoA dioxygenase family)